MCDWIPQLFSHWMGSQQQPSVMAPVLRWCSSAPAARETVISSSASPCSPTLPGNTSLLGCWRSLQNAAPCTRCAPAICPTQRSGQQQSHNLSYITTPQISSYCQNSWTTGTFQNRPIFFPLSVTALSRVSCFSSDWLLAYLGGFINSAWRILP